MADHNELGELGEEKCAQLFLSKKYKIIERNWRFHKNEIDLIAENKNEIVFVEVKTRSKSHWGYPENFLSNSQIKRLLEAVNAYINIKKINKKVRFDVVSIIVDVKNGNSMQIEHFEDIIIPH